MRLCLDFGNTKVKTAVFDRDYMTHYSKSEDISFENIEKIISKFEISAVILSSTRDLEEDFLGRLRNVKPLTILNEHTKLPIQNAYHTPKTLGKDRLAAAVGAKYLYPDSSCIVIDAGTCITMDYVTKEGVYLGGNISPGIWMRSMAMHQYTDKLPLIELVLPDQIIGYDTVTALQNGSVRGAIYELESFIRTMNYKYGPSQIVITGGDYRYFEDQLNFQIFASSNLVLVGLNEILKINED